MRAVGHHFSLFTLWAAGYQLTTTESCLVWIHDQNYNRFILFMYLLIHYITMGLCGHCVLGWMVGV